MYFSSDEPLAKRKLIPDLDLESIFSSPLTFPKYLENFKQPLPVESLASNRSTSQPPKSLNNFGQTPPPLSHLNQKKVISIKLFSAAVLEMTIIIV